MLFFVNGENDLGQRLPLKDILIIVISQIKTVVTTEIREISCPINPLSAKNWSKVKVTFSQRALRRPLALVDSLLDMSNILDIRHLNSF